MRLRPIRIFWRVVRSPLWGYLTPLFEILLDALGEALLAEATKAVEKVFGMRSLEGDDDARREAAFNILRRNPRLDRFRDHEIEAVQLLAFKKMKRERERADSEALRKFVTD